MRMVSKLFRTCLGYTAAVHPRPDDRSSVPDRVGNYLIEERLGTGGMGAVYRAFDQALQRPLAIKRLLPDTRRRRPASCASAARRGWRPA